MKANMVNWLFETKALVVCPEGQPFWYTSGTLGPYYINTHFLYGNENKANELLEFIEEASLIPSTCANEILKKVEINYETNEIYKNLIDKLIEYIKFSININEINFISGGERRDWFFSLIVAKLLNKPHVSIFKNLSTVITSANGELLDIKNLQEKKVLHIADLVTEASSYDRAWIPAIKKMEGTIMWTAVIVDRRQGGEKLLNKNNIQLFSMINVEESLFKTALESKFISNVQFDLVSNYIVNPKECMEKFLVENNTFLQDSLNSKDQKIKKRAELFIANKANIQK